MKDDQCYELFGGIALKNHASSFFYIYVKHKSFFLDHDWHVLNHVERSLSRIGFVINFVYTNCPFMIFMCCNFMVYM